MPSGWLLDASDARPGDGVVLWLKERGSEVVSARRVPFRPPFLVAGSSTELDEVERKFSEDPEVDRITRQTERPSLFDHRPRKLLAVTPRSNFARRRLAARIDALGGYHDLTLYDVDLSAPQLYHYNAGLFPFAPVTWDAKEVRATEPAERIDYEAPPIRSVRLSVELSGVRKGAVQPKTGTIGSVRLGGTVVEEAEEGETLLALMRELDRQDPDLLLTDGGDAFDLPWLYARASALGLSEERFFLGREPAAFRPTRQASSYASYGRMYHRDAAFPLSGRFHVDGEDSFLYGDAAVDGLVDAARLSRLSLQTVARQSPGTCFTAMEMAQAFALGVHIPWKKNRPEEFKSLGTLVKADRGGVTLVPPVGVFGGIDEFDFASLFPHIMVRHNLSTETLGCRCCPDSPHVAPGLGYRSCERRVGLIPRTLAPLLARRIAYKRRLKERGLPPRERERLVRRVKMLKWILVTSFGYQGYRNARFGRIECHEAINAYARDILARLTELAADSGYRVVHGIVDSLWLAPEGSGAGADPAGFARRVGRTLDLPLEYEGRYRWIVFLPAVTHGLGVPNRYYGRYEHGEFKLRGIRSRRHDTPGFLRQAEHAVLERFSEAKDAEGVRAGVPEVLERLDRIAERLRLGVWPIEELVISRRVGQAPETYSVFTEGVAALRQLQSLGDHREAGETVRYVIRDASSASFRHRVTVAERIAEDPRYDPEAYVWMLAVGSETLLAPLGVSAASLGARWGVAAPKRPTGPRSPGFTAQRTLPIDLGPADAFSEGNG